MTRCTLILALFAFACTPADDPSKDDTDTDADTDVIDTDTDAGSTTETDDGVDTDEGPQETDTDLVETDEPEPFSPVGTWTLTGGAVSATAGGVYCPNLGQADGNGSRTLTWGAGMPIPVNLSQFSFGYNCTLEANVLSCTTSGSLSNQGGREIGYDFPLTVTLGAEGTATVEQRTDGTCLSGDCASSTHCPSYTTRWTATKP